MGERSHEGDSGSSPDKPPAKAEQPERKPPEARSHDSGGDAGKTQSGQDDATHARSASSRWFRDSPAGTLDEAMTLKRLGQGNPGQSPADSAAQGTRIVGKSVFSQLRDRLQGDQTQPSEPITRLSSGSDRSGGPRPVERGDTAEKKPYDNPFHRGLRPERHDAPQTQRDHVKNTADNTAHADVARQNQKGGSEGQPTDNAAIRRALDSKILQGQKDTTAGDTASDNTLNKRAGDAQEKAQRAAEQKESNSSQVLSSDQQAGEQIPGRQGYEVRFGYDQTKPAIGDLNNLFQGLHAEMGRFVYDPRAVFQVDTWASRPGPEPYNLGLTGERAEAIRDGLRERGVIGHIELVPHGEVPPPTRMALDTGISPDRQSHTGKDDAKDDPADRVANVTNITPLGPPIDFEGQGDLLIAPSTREGQQRELDQTVKSGGDTFSPIGNTALNLAREIHKVPDNPFGEDPSADPRELAMQIGEKAAEILRAAEDPKELAKVIGEYALGSLVDLAREKLKVEVYVKRQPLYAAWKDGFAGGYDSEFVRTKFSDANRQKMSDLGYEASSRLTDAEKFNVAIYLLIDGRRRQDHPTDENDNDWVMNRLRTDKETARNIASYARLWFERDLRE
jgi:outer membrane protein OmpA-like peptidoglycan-associated protein